MNSIIGIFTAYLVLIGIFKSAEASVCETEQSGEEATSSEPCFDLSLFTYSAKKAGQMATSVELECYVRNRGQFYVVWYREGEMVAFNDKVAKPDPSLEIDTDNDKKFNLKIKNLDVGHRGNYRCQIIALRPVDLYYSLDVLVPPSIIRTPNSDTITANEGESITIECKAEGNPHPKLSWTKVGKSPQHVLINESTSTMVLSNVNESYIDLYSCMAVNNIGSPATSEFKIYVKYKPKIKFAVHDRQNNSVLYTANGRTETISCSVSAYPKATMNLFFNNQVIDAKSVTVDEIKGSERRQYTLTYTFVTSNDTVGEYACTSENEMGFTRESLTVTNSVSDLLILQNSSQVYSDAYVFEWSCLSGSALKQLWIEAYYNDSLLQNQTINRKQSLDHEIAGNIYYRDFYELTKLEFNQTYTLRIRILNTDEWSEWSKNVTFATTSGESEKYTKHKQTIFLQTHHRQHDHRYKHHGFAHAPNANSYNSKHDRFHSYLNKSSSSFKVNLGLLVFILTSYLLF